MHTFLENATTFAAARVPFVVCTLIGSSGSTPGEIGGKILVTEDGLLARDWGGRDRFLPNIGAGRVEARAVEKALSMLDAATSPMARCEWNLAKDIGMTCGGSVALLFERAGAEHAEVYRQATERSRGGKPFVIITNLTSGTKSLVDAESSDEAFGAFGESAGAAARELVAGTSSLPQTVLSSSGAELLLEPFGTRCFRLALFGAGYVAQEVVRLLLRLEDSRIVCLDERQQWLDYLPGDPRLEKRALGTFDEAADYAARLDERDFVLCVTKGQQTDFPIVRAILQSGHSHPFLGVIGSRSKRATTVMQLRKAGLGDHAEDFTCPIGTVDASGDPVCESKAFLIALDVVNQMRIIYAAQPR